MKLLVRTANAFWQLTMHPSELSSGLPVARLSHQSACRCLIPDSPRLGDGLGCQLGSCLHAGSLPSQLNSISSKPRQLRQSVSCPTEWH